MMFISKPNGAKDHSPGDVVPMLWPAISPWGRLRSFFTLWFIKLMVKATWSYNKLTTAPNPAEQPTYSKAYPCRPQLVNRIFFPKAYKAGESLPLYIDIHGGGFVVGIPEFDDNFCSTLANQFNILVISIDYSKTPSYSFPIPTYDAAAITQAILDDESLPIDKTRVAIGGFSAGGHIALSSCQLPELQGKIKAVVAWYVPTDWTTEYEDKLQSRPYKNTGDIDGLAKIAPLLNHGYIPAGHDQRDPLLSINYTNPKALPKYVYAISAEYDMLADEARRLMCHLAGIPLIEEEKYEFVKDGYKWTLVKGVKHGFTHYHLKSQQEAIRRKPLADKMFREAGEWLMHGPFAR